MELDIKAPWIDGKVRCQNGYVYILNFLIFSHSKRFLPPKQQIIQIL